jgi:hypothetical protein
VTLCAFSPLGRPIVATCDWTPGNARINRDSWSIEPDGALGFDFSDAGTDLCWDGQLTATRNGWTLFVDDEGLEWGEHELVLREVGEDPGSESGAGSEPIGEPVAFTPARAAGLVFDDGLERRARALLDAAEAVLDRWERGDLAEAVRTLDAAASALRDLVPKPSSAPQAAHDEPII